MTERERERKRECRDVSKYTQGRERENEKRERGMAGLRGERTILRQPQPTLHYSASMEGDTLDLIAAAWDCIQL